MRRVAAWCVVLLLALTAGVVLPRVTAERAEAAPAATSATSSDGRITLTVTSSATGTLPSNGSTVTLTYVVKNLTDQPAYYRTLTDSVCSTPGYAPGTGLQTDGTRWWIPGGGSATFTCGFLVTQDVTSTATATFDTASNATSPYTPSTATVATTINVADDPCAQIWYAAENAPITGTEPRNTGTLGKVTTTLGTATPYAPVWTISTQTNGAANGSSAFAIDPTSPSRAYFVGNKNGNIVGLFRIDLGTGVVTPIGTGLTAATTTYRLAGAKDGTLWSWATDGNLYSMAAGSSAWVRHTIASVKDVKGQALATTSLQSGDLAVGGNGNLWLLGADQSQKKTYLIAVPAAQASPASATAINATLVGAMNNPTNGGFYNGIDFGADGHLYASSGPNSASSTGTPNQLYDVDMATGKSTLVGSAAVGGVGSVGDLGSCALPRSELRALKTVSTATPSVKAGDTITYTVRVANLGKLASVGATVTDAIPAHTAYVPGSTTLNGVAVADASGAMPYSATNPATEVHSPGANPGVVAAGATAVVRFSVKVGSDLTGVSEISNQATAVDVNGTVPSDDPNTPGGRDVTTVPIAKAGIAVTKQASTTAVTGSGGVTYTFIVTNTGNEPLASVRLGDAVTSNRGGSFAALPGTACAAPALQAGSDANGNGLLDLAERWVYTCTEPLAWTSGDPDTWTVHDLATATGVGSVSGVTPSAPSNGVDVTVNRAPAAIDVRKDAGPVVGPDSESGIVDARYTVTVTNSGQRDGTYGPLLDTPSFPAQAKVVEAKIMAPGQSEYTTVSGAGPFTLAGGSTTLAAGASHEYRVVVRYVWTKTASQSAAPGCAATPTPGRGLYNAASLPAGQESNTSNNAACSPPSPQPDPGIDLQKYASGPVDADHSGGVSAGDTMTYTFVVTNTSKTLTLKNVTVTDPKVGAVTCAQTVLAVDAATTCTAAKYVLTQADVDAGTITNTATASGTPPGGLDPVTDSASTTTPLPSTGGLTLTKTASNATHPGTKPDTGDAITYSFTLKNTGSTTLTNIAVTDSKVGAVTCDDASLAPGASTACRATGTYTVTSADVTAGSVVNIATATAKKPDGSTVSTDASATVLIADAAPKISLTKKIEGIADSASAGLDASDLITYSLTVTNTGNVPVRTIYADDDALKLYGISCQNELLAPGDSTTCGVDTGNGTKRLTLPLGQAALDAGTIANTATAYAYYPAGGTTVSATDSASLDLKTATGFGNSLALTKKAGQIVDVNGNGVTDAGDAIGYAFEVKNTGSQTLNLLEVDDPGLVTKPLTCEYALLRPSETTICISKTGHVLTQPEVDAGTYTNTATAQAKNPQGGVVTSNEASATTAIPNEPKIALDKIAGPVVDAPNTPKGDSRGDTIAYTFRVRNVGGVAVTGVTITDAKLGLAGVTCGSATITPGATLDCAIPANQATYTLTRADVNAMKVVNTATASGTANGKTATATDTATVPLAPQPSITLDKTHDGGDGPRRVGDVITYRFTVKNTGAGTLKNIKISDPRLGIDGFCGADGTTIPVADTPDTASDSAYTLGCTLTGTYTVTQADVDGGRVDNTATVTASAGSGGTVTASDDDTVPTVGAPAAITLVKSAGAVADADHSNSTNAGDTITYRFTVTNTGGTTLAGATITDPTLGLTDAACVTKSLAPGESAWCEKPYTLTGGDLTLGKVTNKATATAMLPPGSTDTPPSATSTVTVVLDTAPLLKLVKTASLEDRNDNGLADAGERVTYTFTVTNLSEVTARNITLASVALDDPGLGALTPTCEVPPGGLAPQASVTCAPAVWRVTPEQVVAGSVHNVATASAKLADGSTTPLSPSAEATVPTGPVPVEPTPPVIDPPPVTPPIPEPTPTPEPGDLRLTKTARLTTDKGTPGVADVGDVITYGFVVANPSGVAVPAVSVTDARLAAAGASVSCPSGPLAPGASLTCADVAYAVTAADIAAAAKGDGRLTNTATARGGDVTSPPASASVPAAVGPAIVLRKTATPSKDAGTAGVLDAGDEITYAFVVTNTGPTPLTGVTLTDPRVAATSCPKTDLAAGESMTCAAPAYVVTAADAAAGVVTNTAKVTATGPGGTRAEASDTAVVGRADSRIDLVKTATLTTDNGVRGAADAGDVIRYSFTVTNPGNVPLSTVGVSDPTLGPVTCPKASLAPHESMACTGPSRTVTQADVDAGTALTNTAVATGTAPATTSPTPPTTPTTPPTGGTTVEGPGTAIVPVAPKPVARVDMTKSFAWAGGGSRTAAKVGDGIVYTFTVVNTGTTTVRDVTVSDPRLAALGIGVSCPRGEVRPGDDVSCRASAPYRITEADARRGTVLNTAVAQATSPAGAVGTKPAKPTSPKDTVKIPVQRGDRIPTPRPTASTPGTGPGSTPGTGPGSHPGTNPGAPNQTDPGHRMPYTGAEIASGLVLGLSLIALGVVLVRTRRPRRRS